MSTELDPTVRIFKQGSRAERISHRVAAISIVLFVATLALCVVAIAKGPSWGLVVAALAFFWGVGAPAWFWYEFFFLYREDGEKGSFELYKHGHQVSIAIWAGLAVSLAALASSDLFKETDRSGKPAGTAERTVQSVTSQDARHADPSGARPARPAAVR
ncbi:MAG: hypothetical protein R3E45_08570 [Rhodocyclaceae bacterium]